MLNWQIQKKMKKSIISIAEYQVVQLSSEEEQQTSGGVIPFIAVVGPVLGFVSGVALLAYGAGYLYGKLTCGCEK